MRFMRFMSSVSIESELDSKPNGDVFHVTLFSQVASLLGDGSQLLSPFDFGAWKLTKKRYEKSEQIGIVIVS